MTLAVSSHPRVEYRPGISAPSSSRGSKVHDPEKARRIVVAGVYLIFALCLLQGPLRKWILPELAGPLYFLPDPFVAFIYIYAAFHGLLSWTTQSKAWLGFALIASVIGSLGYIDVEVTIAAWALGVRSYFLYVPLSLVMAAAFRSRDVVRFLRCAVLLSIPYAILLIVQYKSLPVAWINKAISTDDNLAMVSEQIVRPSGLFTYSGQNVHFVSFLVACFVALMFVTPRRRVDRVLLLFNAPAVATMSVLTGSRGIYFQLSLILIFAIFGAFVAGRVRDLKSRLLMIAFTAALSGVLFITQFGDMYEAMVRRVDEASHSETSMSSRGSAEVLSFIGPLWTAPLLGHGIGRGSPGVARLTGERQLQYGEADPERNVNELGLLLGLTFILLRYQLAFSLAQRAVRSAISGYFVALPLAGFTAFHLITGQITNSPLNAFLPWFAVGLIYRSVLFAPGRLSTQREGQQVFAPKRLRRSPETGKPPSLR